MDNEKMQEYYRLPQAVQIKRIDKTMPLPKYQTEGSVGFDIYSRDFISISPGEIAFVPSNLIIQTPPGYALLLIERSSLRVKRGLTLANNVGVVDRDYCGDGDEIKIALYNTNTSDPNGVLQATEFIERGERIAQGLFVRVSEAYFVEVDQMRKGDRRGFGSTGETVDD